MWPTVFRLDSMLHTLIRAGTAMHMPADRVVPVRGALSWVLATPFLD